jgi:malonate-semialdehyde dehydrogenase (acetylating)/methylmalonate-semialdehyde dehydrogenase
LKPLFVNRVYDAKESTQIVYQRKINQERSPQMAKSVIKNFIDGKWVESASENMSGVRNPATDEILALCPNSTQDEVQDAVQAARDAFMEWRLTIPIKRAEILYTFRQKVIEATDELARIIVEEHGKTLSDARAELVRAKEYIEHPIGIAELLKGDFSEDVGTRVDEYYIREPLGVFALIPPFNFPAMIPLYFTWPIACGNTVVIKPSELTPLTTAKLVELLNDSGLPNGVLNLINGRGDIGQSLITHPNVVGVTFVGSSAIAEKVYQLATGLGKRAQCQGGAKNHALVMNDIDLMEVLTNLVGSCFGHTSQRCFAISNILVHENIYEVFKQKFVEAAKDIKLGFGLDASVTMGPVVSRAALEKLMSHVENAIREGATLLLDGRNPKVEDYPSGYFMGPTILEAEPEMEVFTHETFGPVRCLKMVKDLQEAVQIINSSPFGHTAVIYTKDGGWAREFTRLTNVGQVGINVGTPAPIAFYPVGGRKISFYGDLRGRANDAVDFYTDKKVVVSRWPSESKERMF